jgi:hypothetical protein
MIQRRRAVVFIAENRCPLSDVPGWLVEVRRLQHFLAPLSKGGGRRIDLKPICKAVADLVESLARR